MLYRRFLATCIRMRGATMAVVLVIFGVSVWGFGFVENSFFPSSTRPQFMVDMWLPQGTHIEETTRNAAEVEEWLLEQEGVTHVSTVVGQGALRFLLTYSPEKSNSAYAQFLVDVDDYTKIDGLVDSVDRMFEERYADINGYGSKFQLGPGSTGKIQARFIGQDPDVLRRLADEAMGIMHADPNTKAVRTNWRQRVKLLVPEVIEETANLNGITRGDIAGALLAGFQGSRVGVFRDADLLLPVVLRAPEAERVDVSSIQSLQIWSPAAGRMIPLRQVVSGFDTEFEDEIIWRRDRKRTITAYCDPISGPASVLFADLRPQIEAMELPAGYELEWGGEYEDSGDAQKALAGSIPGFVLMMILVTIMLFNSLRIPFVIWACVPLAVIGVTAGLLSTGNPFGFMSLLGFLSLMGMLIKNAIVLIDQINVEIAEGKELLPAIMDAGVSRLRPVSMAAATTALGMIPLLFDPFFAAMAITIIGGLIFATVLTMIVVPVLYAIVFRVPSAPSPAK